MRASRVLALALALALALPTVASVSIVGAAGADKADKGKDKASASTANKFADLVRQGSEKYEAKDASAAIEIYKKAIQLQPRNPLGHYLLGEAALGAGNVQDAEAAWLQAEQVADGGTPALHAKILFVIADLRERAKDDAKFPGQAKKWDDAKAAWQKYLDFVAKLGDGGAFPGSAQSRMQMIDDMLKQDKAYDVVRQRIKEEDGGSIGGKILK